MWQFAPFLPLASYLYVIPPVVAVVLLGFSVLIGWLFYFPARHEKIQPIRASHFRPELVPTKPLDTIVIGSGSGGCAAANILAQSGQRVLLLEQHYRTGGCTHTFREEGCEWDTGLHYTSRAMGDKTCRPGAIVNFMTKGLQKWTPLRDPYDVVMFPADDKVQPGKPNQSSYAFLSGKDKTVQSIMASLDPENETLRQRTQNYLDLCDDINAGFTSLGLSRILPNCLQFLVQKRVDRLMTFASMTVRDVQYSVLNLGYTAHQLIQEGVQAAPDGMESDPTLRRLKAVLTHPIGDYAVQPREATMAAHGVTMSHYSLGKFRAVVVVVGLETNKPLCLSLFLSGASYCVGPTQNLSIRESSLLRNNGGEVLVDATVKEIIIEKGRAVGVLVQKTSALAEAEVPSNVPVTEIRAKNIVCATSVYNLYHKLLPQDHPVVRDFHNPELRTIQQSNGHVFLFCKIDGDADDLKLPVHNLWYFNSYDLDSAFDKYFADPVSVRPPTVYIGFPCTKDASWKRRYPGVSNCILISDGLWEWFEKWQDMKVHQRGEDYEQFKAQLSKHLLDILYECVPEAKGKVSFHMLGTPLSEVTYLSSWHGGSYGTKCLPSMFDEINRKWTTTPHTPIPGLFLAGSDAYLPAVCGAMHGGLFCAAAILGHLRTLKVVLAVVHELAGSIQKESPKMPYWKAYRQAWNTFLNE